jgi:hypothetical protein
MKTTPVIAGLGLLLALFSALHAAPDGWQTLTPEVDRAKILHNGAQGIAYEIEELLPADHLPEWVRRSCSVIYWRLDWAEVCDEAGRPKFEQLDREIFAGYRARGFKLAFRIMATNQSTKARYVIPRATIERFKIPTITRATRFIPDQVCGIFWSPEFIAAHDELMAAFGQWFDGQPWAAQAELGTIGEWGEMHLGSWGTTTLAAHGWNSTTYYKTVSAYMDQMERHLPRSTKAFCWAPIFNVDPDPAYAHLLRRALDRGWWLRSDGLDDKGPAPFVRLAYEPYRDRLALIGEGSSRGARTATDLAQWFQNNVEGGVALLNPMGPKRLCALYPEVAEHYATLLGPRLTLAAARLKLAAPLHQQPARLLLDLAFRQDGNTPHFRPALLRVQLRSGDTVWCEREIIPATPFAAIGPGVTAHERAIIELPGEPPANAPLTMHVALVDLDHGPLQLPHPGQTADGWLSLGELQPALADASADIKLLFDFARDGFSPMPNVSTNTTDDGLHFEAKNTSEAVFVTSPRVIPVKPDAIYQSHARFRVSLVKPAHSTLFHWLDFRGDNDQLTTFLASPAYDSAGAWQTGTITHRPRANDRSLRALFLGKGVNTLTADIATWLVEEIIFPTPTSPAPSHESKPAL